MTRQLPAAPRRFNRGLTIIELLVAVTIMLFIMVGIAGMLESSWQSFSDLKWQNRVDSEARQALDAMSDSVRLAGGDLDFYNDLGARGFDAAGVPNGKPNLLLDSSEVKLDFAKSDGDTDNFYTSYNRSGLNYLGHSSYYGHAQVAALYIPYDRNPPYINNGVHFAYEYRQPSGINNTTWTFDTVQGLVANSVSNIYFTVKTIYITVTASYNPYPNSIDSRTYTRTLTTAVTLRNPYNMPIPPSM